MEVEDLVRPTLEEIYADNVWQVYAFFAYRLGSREDAEDLTQATFERAGVALQRFDPNRASARTWLLAIARNLLIDQFRRRRTAGQHEALDDASVHIVDRSASAFADDPSLGLDPQLAKAISSLTERERTIVALRYGGDLSGPEIAAIMDLTLSNVQQILSRSLRRMRAIIEEQRRINAAE